MNLVAAIKKAEGPIPELRPPKGEIPFDLPEGLIFNGALIFALLVLIFGRLVHLRRPPEPVVAVPPLTLARRALAAVSGETIVADCLQIVRRYLFNAWRLGPEGATTSELLATFAAHPHADAETTAALEAYLGESDLVRFAHLEAQQLADTCVSRALALVERLDARRLAAEPPPLPVAT